MVVKAETPLLPQPVESGPVKKRKALPDVKEVKQEETFAPKPKKRSAEKARALRLEQNRKAAKESRKRKKAMVEDLQRSLMFFSKANQALKVQNEDLTRRLLQSHALIGQQPKKDEKPPAQAPILTTKQDYADSTTAMHPGHTMQQMASFQQAAAAAMQQAAVRGMQALGAAYLPANVAAVPPPAPLEEKK